MALTVRAAHAYAGPMTTAIDTSILIPRPRAAVWAALTDWSRAGEWMAEASDMRQSTGPLGKGSVLSFRAQNRDRTSSVEAFDEGRLIALASDGPACTPSTRTHSPMRARAPASACWPMSPPVER